MTHVNTANAITLLRLALIPVFVALLLIYRPEAGLEGVRIAAFVVFVTAALSDGVDGYIARHYNQRTRLGAVLDPMADKLLTNISFVFLAVLPSFATRVPMWLPVIVLGRDITIASGSYLLNRYMGPLTVRPRILGKAATVAHSVAIAAVVINLPYADRIVLMTAVISVMSLADYLLHGYEQALPDDGRRTGLA
jgi:CDP-diacylglycerol--glycerol-3-phosphate 3-phosphatidyltransferase